MSISAAYVAGTKGFLAFEGVKEIDGARQKSLWQESDVYGEYTESYKKLAQIGLLIIMVSAVLIFGLSASGRLIDFSNFSMIFIMLFFIGLIVLVPGVWGYFKERKLEGNKR
ncbi:MAG: hypothetical protein ACOC87_03840 [Candidatus Natronoplasma sp.]